MADIQLLLDAKVNRKRPQIAEILCRVRKSWSRNRTVMSEFLPDVYKEPFMRMRSEKIAN